MEDNEQDVLTEILLLMDKYDLYGKIAIPKKHDFEHEVPELYRIAGEKRGVFVNSALTEPFGLTLIEAAACGLPIIAPDDGGPRDILQNCECGTLVNTTDTKAIATAVKQIIADPEKWKQYSKAGIMNIRKHYTWESHATSYMKQIGRVFSDQDEGKLKVQQRAPIGTVSPASGKQRKYWIWFGNRPYNRIGDSVFKKTSFSFAGCPRHLCGCRNLLRQNPACRSRMGNTYISQVGP
jgi:sucrose-phosphate synthase